MRHSYTLPALGAALLVAAGTGVHLGQSAIDLIDPVHFQGPAVHPRDRGAAIDPTQLAPRAPAFASHYGWEEGNEARAADCGDCDALAARDAYAYSSNVRVEPAVEEHWQAPVRVHRDSHGFIVEELAAEEGWADRKDQVERYAYYPIEEEAESQSKPEDYAAYEE